MASADRTQALGSLDVCRLVAGETSSQSGHQNVATGIGVSSPNHELFGHCLVCLLGVLLLRLPQLSVQLFLQHFDRTSAAVALPALHKRTITQERINYVLQRVMHRCIYGWRGVC